MTMMDLETARELVSDPGGMDARQAEDLLGLLMDGSLDAGVGGALLGDLAARGEQPAEVAAFVRALMRRSVAVPLPRPAMDVCGTGGSGRTRFNVSTCIAFILAAADVPVAKHGNRGSRRPNGSFDVLEALDIRIDLGPEQLVQLFEETGLAFMFARSHHPAMAAVAPYRKEVGGRTIFNLAGPLSNPAPLVARMVGTVDVQTASVVAGALSILNADRALTAQRALVLRGEPGIDEASITGATEWWALQDAGIRQGRLQDDSHAGLAYEDLPGGDAPENAALLEELLRGRHTGPLQDMVTLSAGLAIDCWHDRPPAADGPGRAQACELIASGGAYRCLEHYRARSQELAG
ncbi:MAG: anthranilate phosphoribosyltransferase [Planctomycetota bacterium]